MEHSYVLFRKWRAAWRDTMLFSRDFRVPLFLFAVVVVGGGWAYFTLAAQANEPVASLGEAIYLALTTVFMQASAEFPKTWYRIAQIAQDNEQFLIFDWLACPNRISKTVS